MNLVEELINSVKVVSKIKDLLNINLRMLEHLLYKIWLKNIDFILLMFIVYFLEINSKIQY